MFSASRALSLILLLAVNPAHACLFATSTPPEGWYRWASILVAADVTGIGKEAAKDLVTARVVETFKGPEGPEGTITVSVPRLQAVRLDRPFQPIIAPLPGGARRRRARR